VAKANAIGPCDPVCGFTELRTPEELALAYTGRGTLRRKNGSHHRDRAARVGVLPADAFLVLYAMLDHFSCSRVASLFLRVITIAAA
jgi:hypothetical protein